MTAPATPARPATDKQIAFLTKLIDQTGMECEISEELTTKEASALIEKGLDLLNAKKEAKAAAKVAPVSAPPSAPIPTRKTAETSMSMIELLELALEKARALGI